MLTLKLKKLELVRDNGAYTGFSFRFSVGHAN